MSNIVSRKERRSRLASVEVRMARLEGAVSLLAKVIREMTPQNSPIVIPTIQDIAANTLRGVK
jgi:hypothetical protein